MKHPKDLTEMKFNRLTILRRAAPDEIAGIKKNGYWVCKCDCGKETITRKDRLLTGWTKSCGCLFTEVKTTHGQTRGKRTPTYLSWSSMKERCQNPKSPWYHNYGGRGIKICDRWLNSFENFLADMGERLDGMTLDKIDNNGNYEPGNCRWATVQEQNSNRRISKATILITRNGKTQSLTKWCEELNLPYGTIRHRISKLKWDVEKSLFSKIKKVQ